MPTGSPIMSEEIEGPVQVWLNEFAVIPAAAIRRFTMPPLARQAIIDMAAVRKGTAVSKTVLLNQLICLGGIHERRGEAPAALVEVARGTGIMPGMGDVAAGRKTLYTAWDIAGLLEIGDERLPGGLKVLCHPNRMPGYGFNRSYDGSCVMEMTRMVAMARLGAAARKAGEK